MRRSGLWRSSWPAERRQSAQADELERQLDETKDKVTSCVSTTRRCASDEKQDAMMGSNKLYNVIDALSERAVQARIRPRCQYALLFLPLVFSFLTAGYVCQKQQIMISILESKFADRECEFTDR